MEHLVHRRLRLNKPSGIVIYLFWLVFFLFALRALFPSFLNNLGIVWYLQIKHKSGIYSWDELDSYYSQIERYSNAYPKVVFAIALVNIEQENIQQAEEYLLRYKSIQPSYIITDYFLGDLAWRQNQFQKAIDLWLPVQPWRRFIELADESVYNGDSNQALYLMDIVGKSMGDSATAYSLITLYQELLKLDSSLILTICEDGVFAFAKAIEVSPDYGYMRIYYGSFLRECGKTEEALLIFDSVDEQFSLTNQAWASSEKGLTYLRMNDFQQAIDAFEEAMILAPDNTNYQALFEHYSNLAR
jgi:tetratricopeptide (TPR) repeat protein